MIKKLLEWRRSKRIERYEKLFLPDFLSLDKKFMKEYVKNRGMSDLTRVAKSMMDKMFKE